MALERQFRLMEMDRASDSEEHSEDEENDHQSDEKFILI